MILPDERHPTVVEEEFESVGSTDPRRDAEVFLGMIQGKLHERIMLGAEIDDLEGQIEVQVDHALVVMAPYLASIEHLRRS